VDATFAILGPTALRIASGTLDENWGRPKERGMLATLLIYAGRPVHVDTLVEWIWSDDNPVPRSLAQTIYTYATRIRHALRQMESPVDLVRESSGYRLDVDRSSIDYYQSQKLIRKARELRDSGQLRDGLLAGSQALELWRGRPLADLRTDRADNWRRHVRTDEWLPANAVVIEIMLELGDVDGALSRLNELRTEHADDLSLAKLRLTALRRLARYDDASAYYFDVRKRLRENGDEQAVAHLGRFYDDLARADQRQRSVPIRTRDSIVPRQLPHDVADFVGRDQLLGALDTALTTDGGLPSPGVIVLDGMGGVGKTALAVRWCHRARNHFPTVRSTST
jgi:DNA-binding SARP family transcriptional activator